MFGIKMESAGDLPSIFYTEDGSPFRDALPARIAVAPRSQSVSRGAVALRQSKLTSFLWKRDLEETSVFTHSTSLAIDNATENDYSVMFDGKSLQTIPAKSHVVLKVKAGNHRVDLINANKPKKTYEVYLGVEKGTHDKLLNSGADLYVLNIDAENTYEILRAQYRR